MVAHTLFSNSPRGRKDFTINFFYGQSSGVKAAQPACPFFSDPKPLEILKTAGCERVQLIVRLCRFTSPTALIKATEFGNVVMRLFTSDSFHAKFYILGTKAIVDSANLTAAGLNSNRELSLLVTDEHEDFDEIPVLFD
ncbi:MAG: phospholipase D-like domain-containing protein [Pseudolabrys sp.]